MNRYEKTYKLYKDFRFEAAHQLTKVAAGHQCARLHGHSYKLRVHCSGLITAENDWLIDYSEIGEVTKSEIIDKLDHQNLNDILPYETTAENLSFWIMEILSKKIHCLSGIEIFETPTTSVLIEC